MYVCVCDVCICKPDIEGAIMWTQTLGTVCRNDGCEI